MLVSAPFCYAAAGLCCQNPLFNPKMTPKRVYGGKRQKFILRHGSKNRRQAAVSSRRRLPPIFSGNENSGFSACAADTHIGHIMAVVHLLGYSIPESKEIALKIEEEVNKKYHYVNPDRIKGK